MEEKAKMEKLHHPSDCEGLKRNAEADPERARQLEAMERVMRENREVLQRLADS